MRIQLVYFEGCPNVDGARETLRDVLAKCRLTVPIEEVCTSAPDAPIQLHGWGSPTVLVDGVDVGGETGPGGASCRLYRDPAGRLHGAPPASLIEAALRRARRPGRDWIRALVALPGAVLPLLPSVTCPACAVAYAGVLSSLGMGFLLSERVLAPIIVSFLAIGVASVAWSTRSHRRLGPLVATTLGATTVVAGRLVWRVPPLLYAGIILLMAASLWNLWLQRPRRSQLVQLHLDRPA